MRLVPFELPSILTLLPFLRSLDLDAGALADEGLCIVQELGGDGHHLAAVSEGNELEHPGPGFSRHVALQRSGDGVAARGPLNFRPGPGGVEHPAVKSGQVQRW